MKHPVETLGQNEYAVEVPNTSAASAPDASETLELEIQRRLIRDYGFKAEAGRLAFGVCPDCNKKTLHAAGPLYLRVHCNRSAHKCSFDTLAQELYPDLFDNFSARFPATAADDYLRYAWGIDIDPERTADFIGRGTYWHPRGDRGTATVRFTLAADLVVEHLIDPVTVSDGGKTYRMTQTVTGDLAGRWWAYPGRDLAAAERVWIVTHLRDALSLAEAGLCVVALVDSDQYPEKSLLELAAACMGRGRPELVWALGGDPTSLYRLRKGIERARAEGWPSLAAIPPGKGRAVSTWNGLFQRKKLGPDGLGEYLYQGALHTAKSAREKALLIHNRQGSQEFGFDFGTRLYWFKLDQEKFSKETKDKADDEHALAEAIKACSTITELARCLPTPLYLQRNEITDESWFYFRCEFPHGGPPVKNTFTPKQLASASEFKARLMHVTGGTVWKGKPYQLDQLADDWGYNIKEVQTIDYVGYSDKHRAYVYSEYAIQDGKIHRLNEEDYFDLPKMAVKTLLHLDRDFKPNINLDEFRTEWVSSLWTAFGVKGVVSLAFWLGSLFAMQIRDKQSSYPFLEMVGEAGSGKSTLLFFLWRLLGRDEYEGFDATETSAAGLGRTFNQTSNAPTVILESDRGGDKATGGPQGRPTKGLDVESLKKLYNGNPYRTRGVMTNGNETYAPPFRGSVVISQNLEVAGSDAIAERLIHLVFDSKGHNDRTREAAERLEQTPMDEVSGFLVKALLQEKAILAEYFRLYEIHAETLRKDPDIHKSRIVRNHAQMMALVDVLALLIPITLEQRAEVRGFLLDLARERQLAINLDHPLVAEFWDTFDFIEDSAEHPVLDHSAEPSEIAINLVHFEEVVNSRRGRAPARMDLMRVLKTSREHKFVEIRAIHSAINARHNRAVPEGETAKPKTVKCWIFKK